MAGIRQIINAAMTDSPLAAPPDQWMATWQSVSEFCGQQLAANRGVTIPGFAIFTFAPGPKQLGSTHLKPVLWFHQAWSALYHIRPGPSAEPRPRGPISAPVINWVSISAATGISKHVLTSIFKEITTAIGKAASAGDVALDFGFCRARLGSGRYSYSFADQLLAVEVSDPRPTVMRTAQAQRALSQPTSRMTRGAGPLHVAPASLARSYGGHAMQTERSGTGGSQASSLPALTSPNGRYPHTAGGDDDGGVDADVEDVPASFMARGKRVSIGGAAAVGESEAGSPRGGAGSPEGNPAVDRAKRKHVLKKLHRLSRAQEFYESWNAQVEDKELHRKLESQADRRDLEVMDRWAKEDDGRARDRTHLRRQQATHVQSMNAQLAAERALRAKPRAEEMGDVFADRDEPDVRPPDHEFLKKQIQEKKEREAAFDALNDVPAKAFDFAAEKARTVESKRTAALDLRRSYAEQIAHKKARGPQLTQAGDEELNYFFRNQTPEEMLVAEAEERKREKDKARGVLARNQRDKDEKERVARMQAAEDARRERALFDATKALEEDRVVREEVERQRQKISMVSSWETAKGRQEAEKARQKELFHGWTDQLPYRNDSSDSDVDISELAERMRAAESRRKDSERRRRALTAQLG